MRELSSHHRLEEKFTSRRGLATLSTGTSNDISAWRDHPRACSGSEDTMNQTVSILDHGLLWSGSQGGEARLANLKFGFAVLFRSSCALFLLSRTRSRARSVRCSTIRAAPSFPNGLHMRRSTCTPGTWPPSPQPTWSSRSPCAGGPSTVCSLLPMVGRCLRSWHSLRMMSCRRSWW